MTASSEATVPKILPPSRDLDGTLVRGLAWTGGVKWGAQVFAWASTLIVARLLTPDDYGLVGMATVYLGLVTMISEFGVGTTVLTLRELTEQEIAQLNGFSIILGLIGFTLSCLAAVPVGLFFKSPRLPMVIVAMHHYVIVREEEYLESKFGDEYRQYKARVRRWL